MTTEVDEIIQPVVKKFDARLDKLMEKHDEINQMILKAQEVSKSQVDQVKNLTGEVERVAEEVLKLKQDGIPVGSAPGTKSFVDFVQDSDAYQKYKSGKSKAFELDFKKSDIQNMVRKEDLGSNEDGLVMSTGLVAPVIDTNIQVGPRRELTMRNLIPTVQVSSNTFTYVRETNIQQGADYVAEGELKPQAKFNLGTVTDTVKKLAVWMKTTEETLDDVPQIRGYINQLLTYDIRDKEDNEFLFGDGEDGRMTGFMSVAPQYKSDVWGEGTPIDVLRFALSQAAITSKIRPDGIILSEIDWARIETGKDINGNYIFANPQGLAVPLMWGRPIVQNIEMYEEGAEAGRFLVGSFARTSTILDRMTIQVRAGWVDDQFIRNQLTLLAEERVGLAIRRPDAFVQGRFDPKALAPAAAVEA